MGILGAKTLRLQELKKLGFNVPDFLFISAEEIQGIIKDAKKLDKITKNLHHELKKSRYAVRSSALVEDANNHSWAGQFETKLNVAPENLAKATEEILQQAKGTLKGDLSKMSIIIQEFIEPDSAGVTFTRNPLGGREMVIEYHKGRGEDLVSGKIKPERIELFWDQEDTKANIPDLKKGLAMFKKIEQHYQFPQDIEWCIKTGKWYLLQTRPITTITRADYEQALYLDEHLPKDRKFYFEKTEIGEIAPRPTPFTQSLLEKIYSSEGPIKKVYKKYGVDYEAKSILKIIGNELYIDRENELKVLLPAYTFLKGENLKPRLAHLKGMLKTVRNTVHLSKLPLKDHKILCDRLQKALLNKNHHAEAEKFLETFLAEYEIVFEINLLTGAAFKKLELALGKDKSRTAAILGAEFSLINVDFPKGLIVEEKTWQGNSLEVSDESNFTKASVETKKTETKMEQDLDAWWRRLTNIKRKTLEKPMENAIIYNRLREFSRWLVVKNINQWREILWEVARKNHFEEKRTIYFATLEEALNGKVDEKECKERIELFKNFNKFEFPKILFYKPLLREEKLSAVSYGEACGILVDEESMAKHDKKILYTKNLEPRLTKYFDSIQGIVSERGSLLSHLAIIARERGLPVITNFSLKESNIKLGDNITIKSDPPEVKKG